MAKAAKKSQKTTLQQCEIQRVRRADLVLADYNPREIDERARKLLRDNPKRVGLLEPIIWNKQSGNVVSGNQRVEQLDALQKGTGYLLDVVAIDVDATTEKEIAVIVNNQLAQGTWDPLKLQESIRGLDIEQCGFEAFQLKVILPEWSQPAIPILPVEDKDALEVVLVFKDRAEADNFMARLNLPIDEKYIVGELVSEALSAN